MLNKVRETIDKYNMISKGDRVIAGVSGGADSVCLTDVLNRIKDEYHIDIVLVHINHNIRGEEAKRDENFVKKLGEKYGNEVRVYSYNVEEMAKEKGCSVEEMGRKLRYKAFYETAGKNGKIAVAHNMNDNCETMIMRFFRGTGIKGLGGISASRDSIIRPLINITRDEIEKYCRERGLEYCTDSTNEIAEYTRNKIRLNVIPMIQREFNENIVQSMARMSYLMADEENYMAKTAKAAYKECEIEPERISIKKLMEYDRVIQRRIIRLGFVKFSQDLHDIAYDHVENVLSLMNKDSGKIAELPHGLRAVREYDTILFYREKEKKGICCDIIKDKKYVFAEQGFGIMLTDKKIDEKYKNMYTICLDCDKIKEDIVLRNRQPGDRIRLYGGTKTLKKLFIDEKVPLSIREHIPVLAEGKNIIWIKDMKTSAYYKADKKCGNVVYLYVWEV